MGIAALAYASAAQAAPLGPAFTYQGQLKQGGAPENGNFNMEFRLFDAATAGNQIGTPVSIIGVPVSNGLFTVTLNATAQFGPSAFNGEARWLAITVGGTPLTPRQKTTAAPYALRAGNGVGGPNALNVTPSDQVGIGTSNPSAKLEVAGGGDILLRGVTGDAGDLVFMTNTGVQRGRVWTNPAANELFLSSIDLTPDIMIDANGRVGIGTPTPTAKLHIGGTAGVDGIKFPDGTLQTTAAGGGSAGWGLTGNAGTSPGTNFLGTTDNQALQLHVNGARALRIEPNATSPNLIGGFSGNTVTAGVAGATISGGGLSLMTMTNRVTDDYGTVAGGASNQAGDNAGTTSDKILATVGGGDFNVASGPRSTVGGGSGNTASNNHSTIGGGKTNTASGEVSTVGGGDTNTAAAPGAVVAGGSSNNAGATVATIGGGYANNNSGHEGTIGGGAVNIVSARRATVAGGGGNTASAYSSTVGGGEGNAAGFIYATVGGGFSSAANGDFSTVSGGRFNIASVGESAVGGGRSNTASNFGATVGGGYFNTASAGSATVGGGSGNTASADNATVGGGATNYAGSLCAGGSNNGLRCVSDSDCPGGTCSLAVYSTVGGGNINMASAPGCTVGGGQNNTASGYYDIEAGARGWSTVGGGAWNTASEVFSTVGGGYGNAARGYVSTVPGGEGNEALGNWSLAAGRQAKALHAGSFVWADVSAGDFTSTDLNQFLIRAAGGTKIYSDSRGRVGVELAAGGNSWSAISDRNVKENVTPVDSRDVLERLAAIPIGEWNLISQDPSIRHIGPMAQDFHAAFRVGELETHISSSDADGVALAAIQGLYEIVQEKDCEVEELRSEIEDLKELVKALGAQNGGGR